MSLESVFAVLAGWVLLGDMLTAREALGCVLMMGGIVLLCLGILGQYLAKTYTEVKKRPIYIARERSIKPFN